MKVDIARSDYDQVFIVAAVIDVQTIKAGVLFVERDMGELATLHHPKGSVMVRLPSEFIGQSQPRVGMELVLEVV
jgi:hypothetical protein